MSKGPLDVNPLNKRAFRYVRPLPGSFDRLVRTGVHESIELMGFTPEELQTFKDAYKKTFGKDLDDAEASDLAFRLEHLYRALLTPLPDQSLPGCEEQAGDGQV